MSMRARSYSVIGVGLWLPAAAMLSCGTDGPATTAASPKPVDVKVSIVRPSTISRTLEVTGSVMPFRLVQLASPAEGPVVSLRVREGDHVRMGDTLLIIGRREGADAQIASLIETVNKEEANLARVERLLEIDGNSREQRDQAKSAYELAKAQLVKAQEAARDFVVVAPWAGIVARVFAEIGDYNYVSPRQPLLELYDPTTLVAQVNIPEAYAVHLKRQSPATVALDAYPDTVFSASVSRVYPYLDQRMRTREIELALAGNVELLPGMFARVTLQTGVLESALVVPVQALTITPENETAIFVASGGKAQRRSVKTGIEEAGRIQVTEGIRPGDTVIATGIAGLSPGRPIRIIDGGPPQADVPAGGHQKTSADSTRPPADVPQ